MYVIARGVDLHRVHVLHALSYFTELHTLITVDLNSNILKSVSSDNTQGRSLSLISVTLSLCGGAVYPCVALTYVKTQFEDERSEHETYT